MPRTLSPILQPYSSEPDLFPLLDACVVRLARRDGDAFKIDKDLLRHIADWLRAALANGEPWLKSVDGQGRPKKLLKFGSVDAIVREADKAMLKAAQKHCGVTLVDGDEELVEMLDDGYYVVRLLTPAALDWESAEMQHCIGNGAYDDCLNDGRHTYLSLRDPHGKPHATLEVQDEKIVQLQGKQNAPPLHKYLDVLIPYICASGLGVDIPASHLGHVIDVDGVWHPLDNMPEGLMVEGYLDLRNTRITTLPKGLTVKGHLDLALTPIKTLPEGLSVSGDLYLNNTPIEALPRDLTVGRILQLSETKVVTLPDGLSVNGNLHLDDTPIASLPKGLTVEGTLYLNNTNITALPDDLVVGRNIYLKNTRIVGLPESLKVGKDLYLCNTEIASLPDNFSVGGHLDLRRTPIKKLPKNLSVGGDLYLYQTQIETLPDDLSVGGDLFMDCTNFTALPDGIVGRTTLYGSHRILTAEEFRTMTRAAISETLMDKKFEFLPEGSYANI